MGKRDRERREKIQAGLEKSRSTPTDPMEKARLGLCPFPGCNEKQLRAEGAHGFCARHESFVADLLFIAPYIQFGPARAPEAEPGIAPVKTGIVLPGEPGFGVR